MTLLLGNLLLALAWAALRGEFSLATLVTGYVLGYLVLLMLVKGGVLGSSRYVGKVSLFAGLAAFFVWELVRANLRVALDVATPRYHMTPGILQIPLDATRDSEILLLKYAEDWNYVQIADRLGVSHSAVETRLHRARARLRDALAELQVVESK